MSKLPDFVIIGAAKSGTTSLYRYLSLHPEIFMSDPKEPEFFARDDIYSKGLDWYLSLFDGAEKHQVAGEASTIYSLWPHFPRSAGRMSDIVPNAKLIYVMRNPVDRAYSYYVQLVKNYQNATGDYSVSRSFEECIFPDKFPNRAGRDSFFAPFDAHLPDDPGVFLEAGKYFAQLQVFLKYYPSKQVLPLLFDDFLKKPDVVLRRICGFLGIADDFKFTDGRLVAENVAADHLKMVNRSNLATNLKSNPVINAISTVTPKAARQYVLNRISSLLPADKAASVVKPAAMLPETRAYLCDYYSDDVRKLTLYMDNGPLPWDVASNLDKAGE